MFIKNLAGAAAIAVAAFFGAPKAEAAIIDLGFILDGSGSVSTNNYNTARTALSQALGLIPTSGENQYRVAVTAFGGSSHPTVVAPTIVTAANIAEIQTLVANAVKPGGGTPTGPAITNMTNLFLNSAGGLGDISLINITTDGQGTQSIAESAALAARDAGIDGISFEAVGAAVNNDTALGNMAKIAGLGTSGDADAGVIVTDLAAIPNASLIGFVIPVADFDAYGAAIAAKVGQIIDDTTPPNVIPLPAGLPLLLGGLGVLALVRRRASA